VSGLRINRKVSRWQLRAVWAGLVLIAAGVSLSACGEGSGEAESGYESDPSEYESAELEPIKGSEVMRVKFSAEGAERVGLQTASIRENRRKKVIPYTAVIYGPEGDAFAYTSPEPLTFVRREIEVDRVAGDHVVLSAGPPVGTEVVTVGAAEVYGTEFEVAH
jgi:hypothetical protein